MSPDLGFTITVPVNLTATNSGQVIQFAETDNSVNAVNAGSPMAVIRSQYGFGNFISVTNMSLQANLRVRLDGDNNRSIFVPGGSIITLDEQKFRYFDVQNLGAALSSGEIYVLVGWVPPTSTASLTGLK